MSLYIALGLGVVLFIINYFSDEFYIKEKIKRIQAKNFTAGLSLTYIFMHLLSKGVPKEGGNETFFAFVLVGFVIFNLIDSHIFQAKSVAEKKKELKEEHTATFLIYNFFVGASLWFFIKKDIIQAIIFFIPISLHNLLSAASLRELHYLVKNHKIIKFFLSISPILGIVAVNFFAFPESFFRAIIGLVAGSLMYIVFRDIIARTRGKYIIYFVMGIITMLAFLMVDFLGV